MNMEGAQDSEEETPPGARELPPPLLPSLGDLPRVLRIELHDDELWFLEVKLLDEDLSDMAEIKRLLDAYDARVGKLIQEKEGNTRDSLALILRLAHLRYIKGMYKELLETSFVNLNEVLKSSEIDEDEYELVGEVMGAIRTELAAKTNLDTSIKKTL